MTRATVCLLLILTMAARQSPAAEEPPAPEPWADSRMRVTSGLVVWLDAAKLGEARNASHLAPPNDGDPIEVWPDASGNHHDMLQKQAELRPTYQRTGDFQSLRFDGQHKHLRLSGLGKSLRETTVFLVAAPYSCPEWFSAFLSASAAGKNDFESGLNIDQAVGSPQRFEVINSEGAGFPGAKNLLAEPTAYGTVTRMCLASSPGNDGTVLWMNGKRQAARDRAADSLIRMDELVIGARYYTLGGPPEVRGFLDGEIAEVLVFDRALKDDERTAIDKYLAAKFAGVAPLPIPAPPGGQPLVRVKDPPAVQVFVPGFTVRELPVDLTNINNILYRPDGKLVALAYDGNVWLLSDTDGDGLEDKAELFWENKGRLRAPIGMALTPPGYERGNGVFVACKGKLSLVVDTDGDGRADGEIIVADGWHELPHGVDALGVAVGRDQSIYFGLGCADFTNAYQVDKAGKGHYDLRSERGTIMRVAPDFKSREIVATGIRFPVGIHFNRAGDLFCTDQEGATWLANGNPLDELLHIQPGRHYGFPPRHPRHLADVIDEPSTFDYGPQHQSTCGFFFNEPLKEGAPAFGPKAWAGDALVAGYSRGKLYRTQLVKTASGYLARNQLFACLNMLAVDCCLAPDGSLVVACHSGGPDWGSGPTGKGKLFKISYSDPDRPQPVLAWPAGPREVRIEFDRPVDPELLADVAARTEITAGQFVRAGDRFESLWPGYATVQAQQRSPRTNIRVHSAQLTADRRSLVLATDPLSAAVHYAIKLPGMGRPSKDKTPPGAVAQRADIDLDFDLSGVAATWSAGGKTVWDGWLPSLDLAASRKWTAGSAYHDALWSALKSEGELTLRAQLDLTAMLRPAVQPGSKLDYELPPERVTIEYQSSENVAVGEQGGTGGHKGSLKFSPQRGKPVPVEFRLRRDAKSDSEPAFTVSYSTNEDNRPRPLQLHRSLLPWMDVKADIGKPIELPPPPELAGGSWSRGRKLFFTKATCSKCHSLAGQGGEIGPDLSNLIHRDYASVLRDIREPSFAINPDYVASILLLKDGTTLTGVVRTQGDKLRVGDKDGKTVVIDKSAVEEIEPSRLSIMPDDLLKTLGADETRDLLTFLLTSAPSMPHDYSGPSQRPKPRPVAEVNAVLAGAPNPPDKTRPLRVVLVAGPKDHGPGEHDYPAWLKAWRELLAADEQLTVTQAMNWPAADEFRKADVMVFYQNGEWDPRRAADIDAFLKRGGGLVYIHWAVDGQKDAPGFAERIGLSWGGGAKFRHGPLELSFHKELASPITRNFDTLKLVDESYWNLTGSLPKSRTLASGIEDSAPQPLFWSLERGRGRVFVSIPGHFSWTFDDPLYRVLLLRGIAWAANEPVDRFNDLVWPGADVVK